MLVSRFILHLCEVAASRGVMELSELSDLSLAIDVDEEGRGLEHMSRKSDAEVPIRTNPECGSP